MEATFINPEDSAEVIRPDPKLIELADKIIEQQRAIINQNYQIWTSLAMNLFVVKTSQHQEER